MTARIGMLRIILTSVFALVLTIVPLPSLINSGRPDWLLLLVIYWCLTAPGLAGLAYAWLCGLLLDGLVGTLIGQHALGFVLVAFITHRLQLRMRIFPVWQQAFTVLIMLAIYHFLVFWIDGIIGSSVTAWSRWLPALVGAVFWPVLVALMDTTNRSLGR